MAPKRIYIYIYFGVGDIHASKAYRFTWFGDIRCAYKLPGLVTYVATKSEKLDGLVTSMAPNHINLYALVTSMAPELINFKGLVTSMPPKLIHLEGW